MLITFYRASSQYSNIATGAGVFRTFHVGITCNGLGSELKMNQEYFKYNLIREWIKEDWKPQTTIKFYSSYLSQLKKGKCSPILSAAPFHCLENGRKYHCTHV